jgi:hypothetical protein
MGRGRKFRPLPDFALEIIKDGGLLEHIKKMDRKRIMKKNILLLCAIVAIIISVAGCRHRPKPDALSEKINTVCIIVFNGEGHELGSKGTVTGLTGKLLKVTPEWLIITDVSADVNVIATEKYWVPRNAILYIRTQK